MKISSIFPALIAGMMGALLMFALMQVGAADAQGGVKSRPVMDKAKRVGVVNLEQCYEGSQLVADIKTLMAESDGRFAKMYDDLQERYVQKTKELENLRTEKGESDPGMLETLRDEIEKIREERDNLSKMRQVTMRAVQAKYYQDILVGVMLMIEEVAEGKKLDMVLSRANLNFKSADEENAIGALTERIGNAALLYHNSERAGKAEHTIFEITTEVQERLKDVTYKELEESIKKYSNR